MVILALGEAQDLGRCVAIDRLVFMCRLVNMLSFLCWQRLVVESVVLCWWSAGSHLRGPSCPWGSAHGRLVPVCAMVLWVVVCEWAVRASDYPILPELELWYGG